MKRPSHPYRILVPLAVAALPGVLLYSSVRTFHELDEQREVYLRHRVSLLAARLEVLPGLNHESLWDAISADEPHLMGLAVISRGARQDDPDLSSLWNGRELFRTEWRRTKDQQLYRVYVPFHSADGLRIARLDMDPGAADFLLIHARHNLIIASLSGLALVLLSVYSVWATARNAKLRIQHLELEHLARIGTMSSMMAHEIRTPLGTIKGFIQLACERADLPSRELLNPAIAEAERLERLVRDLLAFGRPPAPSLTLVDWRRLAETMTAHARQLIGNRPISLVVSECDIAWQSDPGMLEQILLNLLKNAVEAIPAEEPGQVVLAIDNVAGDILISVKDTGSGISPTAARRLFEPFFTTKGSGTGLGLAITRALVTSLAGQIELHRVPTGGSTAVIRFPKTAVTAAGVGN